MTANAYAKLSERIEALIAASAAPDMTAYQIARLGALALAAMRGDRSASESMYALADELATTRGARQP